MSYALKRAISISPRSRRAKAELSDMVSGKMTAMEITVQLIWNDTGSPS